MKWAIVRRHNDHVEPQWVNVEFAEDMFLGLSDLTSYEGRTVFETKREALLAQAYLEDVFPNFSVSFEVIEEHDFMDNYVDMGMPASAFDEVHTNYTVPEEQPDAVFPEVVQKDTDAHDPWYGMAFDFGPVGERSFTILKHRNPEPPVVTQTQTIEVEPITLEKLKKAVAESEKQRWAMLDAYEAEFDNRPPVTLKSESDSKHVNLGHYDYLTLLDQVPNPSKDELESMRKAFDKLVLNATYGSILKVFVDKETNTPQTRVIEEQEYVD